MNKYKCKQVNLIHSILNIRSHVECLTLATYRVMVYSEGGGVIEQCEIMIQIMMIEIDMVNRK